MSKEIKTDSDIKEEFYDWLRNYKNYLDNHEVSSLMLDAYISGFKQGRGHESDTTDTELLDFLIMNSRDFHIVIDNNSRILCASYVHTRIKDSTGTSNHMTTGATPREAIKAAMMLQSGIHALRHLNVDEIPTIEEIQQRARNCAY